MNCDNYNQYYTDIFDKDRNLIVSKCFKGNELYPQVRNFNINNYKTYKNKEYYYWIDNVLKQYSFVKENYDDDNYSPEEAFKQNCENVVYSLKPQQKFAGRIFNTYVENRGILIYHGLGSGKTQTSIIIGEAFKFRDINGAVIKGREDTRVLIVVPASLKDQYYSEIIGKIEAGDIKSAAGEIVINGNRQYYSSKIVRNAILQKHNEITALEKQKINDPSKTTEIDNKIKIKMNEINEAKDIEQKKINRVYEIITHDAFLNKLFKIEDKQFIEGEYLHLLKKPNGLLIIDEIQRLISETGVNYRKLLYALKYYAHPKFRTVLLTGTPIYDKAFEFGLLINLLRPRLPFPDGKEKFNTLFLNENKMINVNAFKQMCSGYVSYFKGGNPIAYPFKKTTIMNHPMEDYQYAIYKDALINEVEKDKRNKSKNEEFIFKSLTETNELNSGIFNNSNQFSNIAFPKVAQVMNGKTVLQQNINELKKILKNVYDKTESGQQRKEILKTVRSYSSKFSKVAEMIDNCDGPVFVFSNYVYYGVDPMGIIMNYLGYSEYPSKGPRGSYFIWKGEANKYPGVVQQVKKTFNDPKNKDGSLLKIMFGTQTVMEGVDFKNVRQVHILDPWWNDSRIQQIIARAVRLCSHKDLPENKRIVDVFIHLSTLGSSEKVFELKINETLPDQTKTIRTIKSFLQIENPSQKNSSEWIFRQAYVKINKENETIIQNSKETFKGSDIIQNSIIRLPDAGLTKHFGKWKQLDSRSVQEYMYSRSIEKLDINRQFDKVIKEVSLDCNINKNGNVIRLNELYKPFIPIEGTYTLFYENYSTGELYTRLNIKSNFDKNLPENILTLEDILDNTAKKSNSFEFKDAKGTFKVNKSLILSENIECDAVDYSFDSKLPKDVINLTINKELIPYLLKLNKNKIMDYLSDVQYRYITPTDPELPKKIKQFMGKDVVTQRKKIIDELKLMGYNGDDDLWDMYTLEELKNEFKRISH